MATKQVPDGGFAPIVAALNTMQSNLQGKEKVEAHEFLEKFQKSVSQPSKQRRIIADTKSDRGMDCNGCYIARQLDFGGGETVRGNHHEGKGQSHCRQRSLP